MEQESEGLPMALEYDRKVRMEAHVGFQHVKQVENQLKQAPAGYLGVPDSVEAQAMRATMISAAATIVTSFSKIISLLSAPPTSSRATSDPSKAGRGRSPEKNVKTGSLNAESPISTTNNSDTPPPSPRWGRPSNLLVSSSPAMSPCQTPLSGMSEGSPVGNVNSSTSPSRLDSEADAARRNNDASTSADGELGEQRALSKKRKFMPKYTCKQRATGTDQGNDGPPDDGHTWRKYGQKDILGSRYPRSYYRCTHKTELGCPAIKYVQRSDDEPSIFDVTYRGTHSCQSMQRPPWPFPFSISQIVALQGSQLQASDPGSGASLMINSVGGLHLNQPQTQVVTSSEDLMHGIYPPSTGSLNGSSGVGANFLLQRPMASMPIHSPMPRRFGVNPNSSTGLDNQHQNGGLKPENDPAQSVNLATSSRDSLFVPGSKLLSLLLSNTPSPANDDTSMNVDDAVYQGNNQMRAGTVMAGKLNGCNSVTSGRIQAKSSGNQYVERWVDGLALEKCPEELISSQNVPEDITQRFDPSPATSEVVSSSQQAGRPRLTSISLLTERGQTLPTLESEVSEVVAEHSPSSPFAMNMSYMIDNQMFSMEYEPFDTMLYGSSEGDQFKYA